MKRGEIWLVECDPSRGSEANKTRPCVIVSNQIGVDVVQKIRKGVLSVVPLTKNTTSIYPFQVEIPADTNTGLPITSKAQCEQLRATDISRFVSRIGELNQEQLSAIETAILVQLGID